MTRRAKILTAAFFATIAAPVSAQSNGIPAEFPPSTFSGNQYVDSEGCAFIRAGISGITNWVPRVDRTRTQLCNFQPTFALAEPEPVVEDEPEPVVETAAAEPPAARPARNADVGAPIETVASIGTTRAAPTIRFTPEPAAAPAAPVAAPEPVAAPTPAPITMAEACEGRFGVQSRFINNATGEPIDCGPAPQVAADVTPEPRRMTLADACAEMADTGTVLIDAATSRPIACPTPQIIATAPAPSIAVPTVPTAPSGVGGPAAPSTAQLARLCGGQIAQMRTADGMEVRCGPQAERPYTLAPTTEPSVTSRAKTPTFGNLFGETDVPASNPPASVATQIKRPAGYDNVWNDGRLNPNRGLPRQQAAAPRPVGTGHQFVQVGTFGDHNNANRLGQRLAGLGLPVGIVNRGQMKLVVSGPFNDPAALRQALATVRSMGFSDAYTRN